MGQRNPINHQFRMVFSSQGFNKPGDTPPVNYCGGKKSTALDGFSTGDNRISLAHRSRRFSL
jgi:hypothetical protein